MHIEEDQPASPSGSVSRALRDIFTRGFPRATLLARYQAGKPMTVKGMVPASATRWASIHLVGTYMVKTTFEGESYLHKILWRVVQRQIEHSEDRPKGPFDDHRIVIMVFAFHTLEAYLNFVGERLDPELWDNERNEKSISSFSGKMAKVLGLCNIREPDKDSRPYRTVLELKKLRDMIAHGKIEKFSEVVDDAHDSPLQRYETSLDRLVTPVNACIAVDDTREFIDMVHKAALSLPNVRQLVDEHRFPETPFDGVLGHTRWQTG
jgi:hypothetical protein